MPKYDNPVRGFVRCPVCASAASVHQVGEGQLIATGEPPKNSRNLGLQYYRCPECGNSSISKKVNEFIETNKVEEATELDALPANEHELLDTHRPNELQPEPTASQAVSGSVEPSEDEAFTDAASSADSTEDNALNQTVKKPSWLTPKRVLIAFGIMLCAGWMVRQLMPKPSVTQGGEQHG